MATKKDLCREVERLNDKYCKNTKNHLVVGEAYGGYEVQLRGKEYKRGKKTFRRKGSMSGAIAIGNQGYDTATKTLAGLWYADSRGWVKNQIRYKEKNK